MCCPLVCFRKVQRAIERLTVAGAKNHLMRSVPGYHGLEINTINLRPITAPQDRWMTGSEPCVGSQDLCFLTSQPPTAVIDHLRDCAIDVEQGPVTKRGARGPICSVYVRDPDGNLIEISSYE